MPPFSASPTLGGSSGSGSGGDVSLESQESRRTAQRTKQIGYGKNTLGYKNLVKYVPPNKLKGYPMPPNILDKCSKRAWDGQVRKWRRLLHKFDEVTSFADCEAVKKVIFEEEKKKKEENKLKRIKAFESQIAAANSAASLVIDTPPPGHRGSSSSSSSGHCYCHSCCSTPSSSSSSYYRPHNSYHVPHSPGPSASASVTAVSPIIPGSPTTTTNSNSSGVVGGGGVVVGCTPQYYRVCRQVQYGYHRGHDHCNQHYHPHPHPPPPPPHTAAAAATATTTLQFQLSSNVMSNSGINFGLEDDINGDGDGDGDDYDDSCYESNEPDFYE